MRVWDVTARGKPRLAHARRRQWRSRERDIYPRRRPLLTSGTCDGKLKLWNASSGALISTTSGPPELDCGYKGTGTRFYAGVSRHEPGRHDRRAGRGQRNRAAPGLAHRQAPADASRRSRRRAGESTFDRTGARLATGNWDGTAIVWDTRSGARVQTLASQEGVVESVAFSPDGGTLATAGEDATAQLWDIATGTRLLTLTGHWFALTDVAFSPDGSRLATSSGDGTVRVYVLPVGELLALARRRLTRDWTQAECRTYLASRNCPADAVTPTLKSTWTDETGTSPLKPEDDRPLRPSARARRRPTPSTSPEERLPAQWPGLWRDGLPGARAVAQTPRLRASNVKRGRGGLSSRLPLRRLILRR